ncbi:MAG: ribosome maturation factor RimM [Acidobacteriota bacterium]
MKDELVTIAKIVRPQGNRGEVAADVLTDFPDRFSRLDRVVLEPEGGPARSVELEKSWLHKQRVILKFSDINTIAEAEALRGFEVKIPRDELMPLEPNTYYHHELVGCAVRSSSGHDYGKITEVLDFGGNCLLRVASGEAEFLMPFAEALLKRIDVPGRELICDLPEGLTDL